MPTYSEIELTIIIVLSLVAGMVVGSLGRQSEIMLLKEKISSYEEIFQYLYIPALPDRSKK